ncbi:MAG: TolC family protein [Nevskia sp.]|nr:TolC family protein [Nevskia sp.]
MAADTWSLPRLVEQLKRSNPQLRQAWQAYVAARLAVPIADSLPAAQLGLLEQANTGGPFDFNRNSGFFAYPSFTQPVPWPGKLRLAGEVAGAQAEAVGRQYDSLLIQLVAQLKQQVYQLGAVQDQLRFVDEELQRLEQIKQIAKVRYANNAAAYVDFLNAQVAAGALENGRFALTQQARHQLEQINVLVGRDSQQPLQVQRADATPQLPAQPLPELIRMARQANPLIAGGQAQLQAAGKSVELARRGFWPDFSLSAGIYTDPSLVHPETTRMYSLGVSLSLPSWGFRREGAALGQARAQLEATQAGQASNLQQLDLAVAAAYHGLETALQQLEFTRQRRLPQAQMAYRLALSAYGSDTAASFADLLTAQSALRGTEQDVVQARSAAVQAYLWLTAAIGRDPAAPATAGAEVVQTPGDVQ